MSDHTHIQWTDATWNPITGCSVVSAGCKHCYAMRLAGTRLRHHPSRAGLTRDTAAGPVWTGEVRFTEAWLDQPLRWRRPRRIFVCAHGDLFHESVPDEWIERVLTTMVHARQHTYQVLTKRPARMRAVMQRWTDLNGRPLPTVWLGVSVENQDTADQRIPLLLQTPAAVRFISAEPLLGPVQLGVSGAFYDYGVGRTERNEPRIHWVIAGGESGPGARPAHPDWFRSLRDQCTAARTPFFFKQWGEWLPDPPLTFYAGRIKRGALMRPDGAKPTEANIAMMMDGSFDFTDWQHFSAVGKHSAGRLLDGRTWDEFPHVRQSP